MFDIAFGLLLYHFLSWAIPFLIVVFLVVPFILNTVNGDGFAANVSYVFRAIVDFLSIGFTKRA